MVIDRSREPHQPEPHHYINDLFPPGVVPRCVAMGRGIDLKHTEHADNEADDQQRPVEVAEATIARQGVSILALRKASALTAPASRGLPDSRKSVRHLTSGLFFPNPPNHFSRRYASASSAP